MRNGKRITAKIVSVNNGRIILKIEKSNFNTKKGDRILMTKPSMKKTGFGRVKRVADVVTRGEILNVSDSNIVIKDSELVNNASLKKLIDSEEEVTVRKVSPSAILD